MNIMPNISIIIPIFNTALYIERCLKSLFEQTLDDIEYIIINDATQDNAMDIVYNIIKDYPQRQNNIKIINHNHNKGIAYTRQEGHDLATGEYIAHCDSDDWVDIDFYESLYIEAKQNNADMVVGDFMYEHKDEQFIGSYPNLKNKESFKYHPYVHLSFSNRLIRKSFIFKYNIQFYEKINFSEDYGFIFRCYFYSKCNAKTTNQTYYHYNRINPQQVTKKVNQINYLDQRKECLINLHNFLVEKNEDPLKYNSLNDEKRSVKEGYLISDVPDYKKWRETFPEITPSIIKDKKLNRLYRLSWLLGQYFNEWFLKFYIDIGKLKSN